MQEKPTRPVPVPTKWTEPFWEAAIGRQLAIQRCSHCGRYNHPPLAICSQCHSVSLAFEPVSGRGTIYEYTIMHEPRVRGFERVVPYACIAVELEEQDGLLVVANLVEARREDIEIGLAVEVTFEETGQRFVLPQFRPRRLV